MRNKLLCCVLLLLSLSGFAASTPIDLSAPIPANTIIAGPTSGSPAIPTARAVVISDIPAGVALTANLATVATTGVYSDLSGKPTLSTVATTGAYTDLSGKPTLGTAAAFNSGTTAGTIPVLNGSALIAPTLLGSGTGITTKFLQGDGTWQTVDLSNLNATNLTSGTVPDARFPVTLPALSGINLTALNASNLGSGTIPNGRFPATLPAASGVNLTALNGSNVTSGTVAAARLDLTALSATNLTSGTVPDARFPATLPASSGVNLTALNASNLASGTVPDARFPATLPAASGVNLTNLQGANIATATIAGGSIASGTIQASNIDSADTNPWLMQNLDPLNLVFHSPGSLQIFACGLYSDGSVLHAYDSSADDVVISPHATDAPKSLYTKTPGVEHVYKSRNGYRGETEWINVSLLAQKLDALTPGQPPCRTVETDAQYTARTGAPLKLRNRDADQAEVARRLVKPIKAEAK